MKYSEPDLARGLIGLANAKTCKYLAQLVGLRDILCLILYATFAPSHLRCILTGRTCFIKPSSKESLPNTILHYLIKKYSVKNFTRNLFNNLQYLCCKKFYVFGDLMFTKFVKKKLTRQAQKTK